MNRRRFLELVGMTVAAGTVAYSFPRIIVPRNLEKVSLQNGWPIAFSSVWGYHSSKGLYYIVEKQCVFRNGIITIPSFTIPSTIT